MCTHCGQPPLSISCTKGPTCVQPHGPTEDPIKQVQVHYTVALVYARYMRGVVWYTHGIRTVYARYTLVYAGIRWQLCGIRMVYAWYTGGICGVRMVYAWYTRGIRMVYAWYTRGIVWYAHGIRSYTLVYASGCGLISAAQNRRFEGETLYTSGMLCPHHAIHWKGTSIQSTCYSCGCYTRKSNKNMIQVSFQSVVKDLPMFHGTWLRTDAASILV